MSKLFIILSYLMYSLTVVFAKKGFLSLINITRILSQVNWKAISINRWKFFWGCTNLIHKHLRRLLNFSKQTITTLSGQFVPQCCCYCVLPDCKTSVPASRRPLFLCIAEWAIVEKLQVKSSLLQRREQVDKKLTDNC